MKCGKNRRACRLKPAKQTGANCFPVEADGIIGVAGWRRISASEDMISYRPYMAIGWKLKNYWGKNKGALGYGPKG